MGSETDRRVRNGQRLLMFSWREEARANACVRVGRLHFWSDEEDEKLV